MSVTFVEQRVRDLLAAGEGTHVEFKRAGGSISRDVLETVCSFANGFGGTIILGVLDDGTIQGLGDRALELSRNLVNALNNPALFNPVVAADTETVTIDGRTLLYIWVPPAGSVVFYKGTAYERRADADLALHTSTQIAQLAIRKQDIYTEKKVFPYLTVGDLRADVIEDVRARASGLNREHPWRTMSDEELLRSARLIDKDYTTGEQGVTLAGALLFGTDAVIASVAPAYRTDVVIRVHDTTRYDDRLLCQTNLIEAYTQLFSFCSFRMPDPFYMEGDRRLSVRDRLLREILVNSLIHREYASPFPARITIEADRLIADNASKAAFVGPIRPETNRPITKNPLIANVFRQIDLAEEFGSGTRALFEYSRAYSGHEPELNESDTFTAVLPLPNYRGGTSAAAEGVSTQADSTRVAPSSQESSPAAATSHSASSLAVTLAKQHGQVTRADLEAHGVQRRTAQRALSDAVKAGLLCVIGAGPSRRYQPT